MNSLHHQNASIEPESDINRLDDEVAKYAQLSLDAYNNGDVDLGHRLGQHALDLIDEVDDMEVASRVARVWSGLQDVLAGQATSVEVFDESADSELAGRALPEIHRLLTGSTERQVHRAAQDSSEGVSELVIDLAGGAQYVEVYQPQTNSLHAHIQQAPVPR